MRGALGLRDTHLEPRWHQHRGLRVDVAHRTVGLPYLIFGGTLGVAHRAQRGGVAEQLLAHRPVALLHRGEQVDDGAQDTVTLVPTPGVLLGRGAVHVTAPGDVEDAVRVQQQWVEGTATGVEVPDGVLEPFVVQPIGHDDAVVRGVVVPRPTVGQSAFHVLLTDVRVAQTVGGQPLWVSVVAGDAPCVVVLDGHGVALGTLDQFCQRVDSVVRPRLHVQLVVEVVLVASRQLLLEGQRLGDCHVVDGQHFDLVQTLDVGRRLPVLVGVTEPEPEQCKAVAASLSVGRTVRTLDALDEVVRCLVTPLVAVLERVVHGLVHDGRRDAVVTVVPADVVAGRLLDQSLGVDVVGRVVTIRVLVHRVLVGACLLFHAGGLLLLPDPIGAEVSPCMSVVVCHENV